VQKYEATQLHLVWQDGFARLGPAGWFSLDVQSTPAQMCDTQATRPALSPTAWGRRL
jgi:hypothetical protein